MAKVIFSRQTSFTDTPVNAWATLHDTHVSHKKTTTIFEVVVVFKQVSSFKKKLALLLNKNHQYELK